MADAKQMCPGCGTAFGDGELFCASCGRTRWGQVASLTLTVAVVFTIGLLVLLNAGPTWLRVGAGLVCAGCVWGLVWVRSDLLKADGVRAARAGQVSIPSMPPAVWVGAAAAAVIGYSAVGIRMYNSYEADERLRDQQREAVVSAPRPAPTPAPRAGSPDVEAVRADLQRRQVGKMLLAQTHPTGRYWREQPPAVYGGPHLQDQKTTSENSRSAPP